METRTPACPIAPTRYAPDRAARQRLLATAAALSLLVHGGLLVAITLVAQQPPAPPVVQVDEGTPVEVVLDGAAAPLRTALAGASLPLEAMPPAAMPEPTAAAAATPDAPVAAVDQPPAAAAPAPAEPVAALAAEPPPPPADEPPAPPSLVADAAPTPSEPAPAAPPALVFAENEPAPAAPEAPGPALEAGAPPMAAPSFSAPADVADLPASETRVVETTMPDLAAPDRANAVEDAGHPTAVATSEPASAPTAAPVADALPPPKDSPASLPQDPPALAALAPAEVPPPAERTEPPAAEPTAPPAVTTTAEAPVEAARAAVAEPPRSEPARSEPAKAEPAKTEPLADEPPPRAKTSPAPTVLAMVAPPASIVPSDPRRGVEDALQSLDCAHVSAKVDLLGGTVTLSGHARSGDDRARLATTIAALPGIRRVDTAAVSVVGEPYCRVLTFLGRPEFQRSTEQRGDLLTLGAASGPGTRRAVGGETLAFTMSAPEFDAFLYVDHFSADGRVMHLLPTDRPDNVFKKDAVFRLGPTSPLGRKAVVGPPYGLDVVVVVASSEPIFVRPRPASEEANPYLAALDGRLRSMAEQGIRPRLEYAYYLVSTSAPPGR